MPKGKKKKNKNRKKNGASKDGRRRRAAQAVRRARLGARAQRDRKEKNSEKSAHSPQTAQSDGKRKGEIKVALIGVGNVASALVQSLHARELKGVWHESVGGYRRNDIKVVGAFDIDRRKVGKDLSEAIFSEPNVSPKFVPVENTGVTVQPGIAANYEIPKHLGADSAIETDNFVDLLKACGADIVLNLIPSGMQETSLDYAAASIKAGCSFINATPAAVASDQSTRRRFESNKLVVVGDDLLSQFGGTAFHKGILDFMNSRGLKIEKSYQLDVGGGSETLNTINEEVKFDKRSIKTESISEELPYAFETVAGTTDYVDYMGNNRTSYFWIQAKSLFDSEVKIDVYLRTNDGANACNVLFDVIRAVATARQQGRYGCLKEICDYGFKKSPEPALLRRAHNEFLARYA